VLCNPLHYFAEEAMSCFGTGRNTSYPQLSPLPEVLGSYFGDRDVEGALDTPGYRLDYPPFIFERAVTWKE